jgi:hypothetical protein
MGGEDVIRERARCAKCDLFHGAERTCTVDAFSEALSGVTLTAQEEKLLRWLASMDESHTWVGLFARLAGAHNARDAQGRVDDAERAAALVEKLYASPHRASWLEREVQALRGLHRRIGL